MEVTLIVLGAALVSALVAFTVSSGHSRAAVATTDALDPDVGERRLVRALARLVRRSPRAARFVKRRMDPTVASGLALTTAWVVLFGTALVVGAVLDQVDTSSGLAHFDQSVAEWGSHHADGQAVDVLQAITNIGGTVVVAPVVVLTVAYLVLRGGRHRWSAALFVIVVSFGVSLVNSLLKGAVDRERPDVLQLTSHGGSSFPSGHSATAAACWAAVAFVLARDVRSRVGRHLLAAGAIAVAVTVAASRALLGVHWLTDVVAGLAVGWGWFFLVAIAFGGRRLWLGDAAVQVAEAVPDPVDRLVESGAPR